MAASAAATAKAKNEYLAAEARWLAPARSHDLQQRQSSDDFNERLNTAAKARKATLEKFRVTASWHR
jgi:hypothetical protein